MADGFLSPTDARPYGFPQISPLRGFLPTAPPEADLAALFKEITA
jgi:hypothetical protein